MKRSKKKLPPLEKTCAFCRSPIHENDSELISRYEERVDNGDTQAMVYLAYKVRDGSNGLRKDEAKAFELFNRAADLGSAEAIAQLGTAAYERSASISDRTKAKEYFEDGARKGDVLSRTTLGALFADEGNIDLAIKHFHLAAAAGDNNAMKGLWDCFNKGKLSKPDLEKALRSHKEACDEMKSEERERYEASQDALAGNDTVLQGIYGSYYMGFLNAKELKKALKAYQAGDRGAVETLLQNKILAAGLDIESLEEHARPRAT